MATSSTTVHIRGAGPTGSLAAIALASKGFSVVLNDPLSREELLNRSRAYAITHSSRRLLTGLNLWNVLLKDLIPFHSLDLRDSASGGQVLFGLSDLRGSNRRSEAIGWILDHHPLMELLLNRLQQSDNVDLHLGSPAPQPNSNDLIVAADGPRSTTRLKWGIRCWTFRYCQGCLTSKVALRGVQPGMAYELFRSEGPLAILPLGEGVFQVVWSAPWSQCQRRADLATPQFLDELASVLPAGIEPDLLLDSPRAFPQHWSLARRLSRGRGVLIGEAGHRCHPVGGQGLNLCWRDVTTLMNLAQRGGISGRLARRYGQKRWADLLMVGLATDLLVRMFSNQHGWLLPFRRVGLEAMARNGWLRRISLRAMTDGPTQLLRPLAD